MKGLDSASVRIVGHVIDPPRRHGQRCSVLVGVIHREPSPDGWQDLCTTFRVNVGGSAERVDRMLDLFQPGDRVIVVGRIHQQIRDDGGRIWLEVEAGDIALAVDSCGYAGRRDEDQAPVEQLRAGDG